MSYATWSQSTKTYRHTATVEIVSKNQQEWYSSWGRDGWSILKFIPRVSGLAGHLVPQTWWTRWSPDMVMKEVFLIALGVLLSKLPEMLAEGGTLTPSPTCVFLFSPGLALLFEPLPFSGILLI